MTQSVTIHLDSVVKYRNQQEWTTIPRAYTVYDGQHREAVGYGQVEKQLLSILREKNCPIDALVHVLRGTTPVYVPMPLNRWLSLDLDGNKVDKRPEHLRKTDE